MHREALKANRFLPDGKAIRIVHDFEYLLESINRLKDRCNNELNFIMSEAAVNDAEWSKAQSKSNHKFTVLATIYVPLSFSSGLFGMNFLKINTIRQGFILWTVVTLPLFFLSLFILIWDREYIQKVANKFRDRHDRTQL